MKTFEKIVILAAVIAGVAAIALVLTFTLSPGASTAERALAPYRAPGETEGLVTYVSGGVFVYRGSRWKPVEIGEHVRAGDFLKTFENSSCDVQIGRRAVVVVLENTAVRVEAVLHSAGGMESRTEILFGAVLCKAEKLAGNENLGVRAGTQAFGVRGTEFLVERRGGIVVCAVKEGRVAAAGAVETVIAAGRELVVDEAAGRAGAPAALSAPRRALLDRLADVPLLDTDPGRETELVKVGIEVEPAAAEILVNGRTAGFGSFGGLFSPGVPIPVLLRKSGYKEETFTITPKRGDDRIYAFRLDLDAPDKPVGADGAADAYEIEIRRLRDETRKAAADNRALKAANDTLKESVDSLRKDNTALNRQLEEANRKIRDALDKLK